MTDFNPPCKLCGSIEIELGGPESRLCKACGYWENVLGNQGVIDYSSKIQEKDILDGIVGWTLLTVLVLAIFAGAFYITSCHCIQYPGWAQG